MITRWSKQIDKFICLDVVVNIIKIIYYSVFKEQLRECSLKTRYITQSLKPSHDNIKITGLKVNFSPND
ncbi:Uncharacterised protein [Mycoplasmopsis meleagridis]|nr:Uncharacterised protein [Mycoplasmopsis meleagridis]VEU77674.1 Uncharacterised protein [Mycoplasmopsis meleagridis]